MFLVEIGIVIYKSLPAHMRWVLKFVHGYPFYFFRSVFSKKILFTAIHALLLITEHVV